MCLRQRFKHGCTKELIIKSLIQLIYPSSRMSWIYQASVVMELCCWEQHDEVQLRHNIIIIINWLERRGRVHFSKCHSSEKQPVLLITTYWISRQRDLPAALPVGFWLVNVPFPFIEMFFIATKHYFLRSKFCCNIANKYQITQSNTNPALFLWCYCKKRPL